MNQNNRQQLRKTAKRQVAFQRQYPNAMQPQKHRTADTAGH